MFPSRPLTLTAAGALLVLGSLVAPAAEPATSLGLKVPPGFEVSLYADDDLAHDIFALTFDARGRVVVSGPGYVRVLIDRDGDHRADEARTFAEPPQGAQGMAFHDQDLLCTAEGGLVRYRDRNGDDRADGPPDVFLRLKTGGEHDAHAIHRGPDGWWYLMVGNSSAIGPRYITTTTSPVTSPRAGALLRLAPDLGAGEIYAHGFRNAYDFTFDAVGEVFTADADGERDVSLPWYLPNRCLHVLLGSDAGWVTESWKRQDGFLDMTPVVASLGRGSPTGVVCYRHIHFPTEYQAALFVLDWTYGRILMLRPQQQGGQVQGEPAEFVTAAAGHGFAPTSAAVGPDGALYVSVGGRGTRGAVYRIHAPGRPTINPLQLSIPTTPAERLALCLRCPEPLSSWGRKVWEPLATALGSEPLIRAAADESRLAVERLRAIEILTEKFHGLDSDLLEQLARSQHPAVRVRAAWSIGRTETEHPRTSVLARFLQDDEPFVVRVALESLLGARPEVLAELVEPLARALYADDPWVRQAAVRVVVRTDEDTYQAIAAAAAPSGWQAGISLAAAYAERHPGVDPYTVEVALKVLGGEQPLPLKREAARLLQLGLGDCGPPDDPSRDPRPAVFEAYASRLDLTAEPDLLQLLRQALPQLYPQTDPVLNRELSRIIAMVQPTDARLVDQLLAAVTAASDPVDDLHQMIVVARLPGARSETQRAQLASTLLQLEPKLQAQARVQDSHWNDRVMELYEALADADPQLPVAVLRHPDFGRPGHAQFLSALPPSFFPEAVARFSEAVLAGGDEFHWNDDVIYLLAHSEDERIRARLREQFDNYGLRGAVLLALAEQPREADRDLFVAGLGESQFEVLAATLRALALLPPDKSAAANVALLRTLRRLGTEGQERQLRDQVFEVLRRNTGADCGYQMGREGDPQAAAIAEWTRYISTTYPAEYAAQSGADAAVLAKLQQALTTVPWDQGDPARGRTLFEKRACAQCHGGGRAVGPDLQGVTSRFSRDDLFTAIVFPDRDVSPRYQAEMIVTQDGRSYSGLVVYEAVDGLVMRDAQNRTIRIEVAEIETRRKLVTSLMPGGLLNGLQAGDLADLYAYLRSLTAVPGTRTAQELLPRE